MAVDLHERTPDPGSLDAVVPLSTARITLAPDAPVWPLLTTRPAPPRPPAPPDPLGLTPWAQALSEVEPGPGLATLLDSVDPDSLTDDAVVEMVAASRRLASWVHAQSAAWAAALARRPSMRPSGSPSTRPQDGCVAADELAMRLSESRRSTAALVAEGVAYDGILAPTGDALRTGQIDPSRARVLVDRLAGRDATLSWDTQERLLPEAGRRTVTQLRRDVDRVLAEVDGAHAAERHREARRSRVLRHPIALPDGMAAMWWVLPAVDAARIDGLLDCAARTARSAGDPRTLDQLRCDGLRDLALGPSPDVATWDDPDTSLSRAEGIHDGAHSPSTEHEPLEQPLHSSDREHLDARSARDQDHTGVRPHGGEEDSPPSCTRPHGRTTVHVTVSLSTLLGLDDRPAELHGLGPIDADQARGLAHSAGSTWRRLVTDPLTDAVLDVGRIRYRPPAPLVAHIRARDRRCARPGCDIAAERCDLDHTIEYFGRVATPPGQREPAPGTTAPHNLGPLCRHDHGLKSGAGFVLRQPSPGLFEWLTPTGHRYRLRPGADRAPEHLGRDGQPMVPGPTQAELDARDGPPPF